MNNTQHLSKLSTEEIKTVRQQWPNPLTPVAAMMGGLIAMMYGLFQFTNNQANLSALIGGVVVFILLSLGSSFLTLIKLSKAKKTLNRFAEKYALPQKELFKEFKKNLKQIKAL